MEKRLFYGFFDTLILSALVVVLALYTDGTLLRVGISCCILLAIVEIWLAKCKNKLLSATAHDLFYFEIAVLFLALVVALEYEMTGEEWILVIGMTVATDAGGLAFGRAIGGEKVPLLGNISPNKTYVGYIGEALCSWVVGIMIILILDIEITPAVGTLLVSSWFVAAVGDLCGSLCKRNLRIKDSDEVLRTIPFIGKLEVLARSRHGYLDCFDSMSMVFIYYAALTYAMRSLT
jgi:phosphatidate cytidylyltransferase